MAVTTMDQLVAAIAGAQYYDTFENSMTAKGAGLFQSLWTAGGNPGAGGTPATGSGAVPTNATAGAIPFVNPTTGNTLYLARAEVSQATLGSLTLYDRLVHSSGLSGIVTTAQTVNSTALTRYTTGVGVGCYLEWYTASGSTAVTATISYTNSSGTAGRSGSIAIAGSPVAGQVMPMVLAAGDVGVQSVQSVTLSATTGTAGNFGITLSYRIATIPIVLAGTGMAFDYAALGLPIVQSNACLAFRLLCSTTSSGLIITGLTLAQG